MRILFGHLCDESCNIKYKVLQVERKLTHLQFSLYASGVVLVLSPIVYLLALPVLDCSASSLSSFLDALIFIPCCSCFRLPVQLHRDSQCTFLLVAATYQNLLVEVRFCPNSGRVGLRESKGTDMFQVEVDMHLPRI